MLVGGVWPRAVVGGGPRRIELLIFLDKIGKIIESTLFSVNMHIVLFCALV